jgi:hypothetical protein
MFMRKVLVLVMTTLFWCVRAGEVVLYTHEARHKQLIYAGPELRIQGTPQWDGLKEVPLGPGKVAGIAKAWFKKYTGEDAYIFAIMLRRPVTKSDITDSKHWFYVVHATTVDPNDSIVCVVLMDGSIVEPKERSI